MSAKTPEAVAAETRALIEETERLNRESEQVVASAKIELAKSLGQDPATFDLEAYVRKSIPAAKLDKLLAEARAKVEAEAPPVAPPVSQAAGGSRPGRRMV